eukprot:TRINITY_DN36258_c0_g1_i4.p1 TRINITY_DN36258_c0_g1~~TRINITY_DN36258_c0_g1_i4.p1  ORF type:complete len:271 (-),score=7.79 TRINITY_DN36258_c0_g1_i4:453-1265(-)
MRMINTLLNTDFILMLLERAVRLAVIVVIIAVALRISRLVIQKFFLGNKGLKSFYLEEKRARTLESLLSSIVRYVLYFIAGVMMLQELNINTTSIVAGAGIIGLALGVGAQSLIKDFITGFFIIMEDQYAVGDYIVSGEMAGTVEEIGFRVTKLRDGNGIMHILPNGSILRVSNYSRGHMLATINIPVPYSADIDKVMAILDNACAKVKEEVPEVLEIPKVIGIVDMRPGEQVIRIISKTTPLEQGKVEAALRYKVVKMFKQAFIKMPIC